MRIETRLVYVAYTGDTFTTEKACLEHEAYITLKKELHKTLPTRLSPLELENLVSIIWKHRTSLQVLLARTTYALEHASFVSGESN